MNILRNLKTVFGALVISALMIAPACALDLGEAKSAGLVGETTTGYLAAVKSSKAVNALVSDINGRRKAHYQKIAEKNKISLEALEVRAGQKAISKTTSGNYVDSGSGWQKK